MDSELLIHYYFVCHAGLDPASRDSKAKSLDTPIKSGYDDSH